MNNQNQWLLRVLFPPPQKKRPIEFLVKKEIFTNNSCSRMTPQENSSILDHFQTSSLIQVSDPFVSLGSNLCCYNGRCLCQSDACVGQNGLHQTKKSPTFLFLVDIAVRRKYGVKSYAPKWPLWASSSIQTFFSTEVKKLPSYATLSFGTTSMLARWRDKCENRTSTEITPTFFLKNQTNVHTYRSVRMFINIFTCLAE